MKNKKLETLLYSAIGVAVMFIIVIAVNAIVGAMRVRMDMTADKLHTLDPGTKAILKKLDAPVEIRFYCSKSESRMPSDLRSYATHVEDLLADIKQAGKGKIELKKLDPKPDSEAEDLAALDGIEAIPLPTGDRVYLGLAISLEPVKVALPMLTRDREKLLEYDIARAIAQVISTNKPVIGVMTPLPMFGMPGNPMMARMGQPPQGQDPWVFLSELKRDFDVRQVPMETEKIEGDIKVLLVVHPKDIKDTAQYAIDQFIMRGGKLIAFVDPLCLADAEKQQSNPMMGAMPSASSTLDKLFKAWGVQFDSTKVLADLTYAARQPGRPGQPAVLPTYLLLDRNAIDKGDVVGSQVDEILLPCPGVFTGTPATGLKQSVLLKTSDRSQLVDGFMVSFAQQKIAEDLKASGTSYPLAIRLSGKFKTAFPEGKPENKPDDKDKDTNKEEKKDKPEDQLKETKADNVVTLVGDVDLIYDRFCARVQNLPFFGQKIVVPQFGNLTLAQAMVEQSAGDNNLIGARSRASLSRPFLRVKDMQAAASQKYQDAIKKLEAERQEAQSKLNELRVKQEPGQQRIILTKEQQDAILKYKQQEAEAGKKLKQVRKDLRQEIDSLETRLKWLNIAGMPFLVTVAGLCLATIRRQRTKAK